MLLPICHAETQSTLADLLETLLQMSPTKEEEINLRDFKKETSPIKLGPAEKFLKAVLESWPPGDSWSPSSHLLLGLIF